MGKITEKFFEITADVIKKLKHLDKKTCLLYTAGFLVLIAGIIVIIIYQGVPGSKNKETPIIVGQISDQGNSKLNFERYIDGVLVATKEEAISPIVAVMLDNQFEARPSSGLSSANLVIEMPMESVITRFLAYYQDWKDVKEIGPVRSARPYAIDWVQETGAFYLHVGGSAEALDRIEKENIKDLNEYYNGEYFWRDPNRSRPHNVMTSGERINNALAINNFNQTEISSWKYKDNFPSAESGTNSTEVSINFGDLVYTVKWVFNRQENSYLRYQGGEIQKDKDGSEIKAKNIILQYVKHEVLDSELRKKIETVGSGKAQVFLDGKIIEGSWNKPSQNDRTKFFDLNGNEIKFNRGTSWIEIVPDYALVN